MKLPESNTVLEMTCLVLLGAFVIGLVSGCATTVTTGAYNAESNELKFKSYTTFIGGAAGENAKALSFLVEAEGFHVEAEGQSQIAATTPDINALAQAIAAGIATAFTP